MTQMRNVRKRFRRELLRLVSAGEGTFDKLTEFADLYFGTEVPNKTLMEAFAKSEVSNALAVLRREGQMETVGKRWKLIDELEVEDVEVISVRRLKRLCGELREQIKLAHRHGRIEDAVAASRALEAVESRLSEQLDNEPSPVMEKAR